MPVPEQKLLKKLPTGNEWELRVKKVLGRGDFRHIFKGPLEFKLQSRPVNDPKALKKVADGFVDYLAVILREFVKSDISPYLIREWRRISGNPAEYSPRLAEGAREIKPGPRTDYGPEDEPQTSDYVGYLDYTKGWNALYRYIQVDRALSSEKSRSGARVTLGHGVYNLKSEDAGGLPVRNSNTELNSWFLNVEWGTGISANVGAPWVNREGRTKDPSGDGSWWLGRKSEKKPHGNVRILGQKGWHAFWDENTRKPVSFWQKLFEDRFPEYLQEKLQDYFNAAFGKVKAEPAVKSSDIAKLRNWTGNPVRRGR